jgi:type IV fimbrial biogenesis protein FimT
MRMVRTRVAGRRAEGGFTLAELMIVVVIAGMLLAIAVPGFRSVILGNSVTGKVNELVGAMQIARNEAVTRNARVTLCPMDPTSAVKCKADGSFQAGWIVFGDRDDDETVDANEEIYAASTGTATEMTFDPVGLVVDFRADGSAGVAANTTVTVCRQEFASRLTLEPTGRAYATKLTACP